MEHNTIDKAYIQWIASIKDDIRRSQIKAAITVNRQLVMLYWRLGQRIIEMEARSQWGDKLITQLSKDLLAEFPDMRGLSRRNLIYCKQFYSIYSQDVVIVQQVVAQFQQEGTTAIWQQPVAKLQQADNEIVQQVVEQLEQPETPIVQQAVAQLEQHPIFNIPWGHHILIMQRCKDIETALFYVRKTVENNWSRSMLDYHIDNKLIDHLGHSSNNFDATLPAAQGDLATALLKDHYTFDFLAMSEKAREHDIEQGLVEHVTQFLLELGQGFAYMGRQYLLKVGSKEYRTDLLFYHTKLRCYIVIELKAVEFEPEFVGKLAFYTSAIDRLIKDALDRPTIGVLLCRSKDDFEVEIALQDINKPIGVSTYSYHSLPEEMKPALAGIQQLQQHLNAQQRQL